MNTCSAPANLLRIVLTSLIIAGIKIAVPSDVVAADADSRIVLRPQLGCQATPKSGGFLVIKEIVVIDDQNAVCRNLRSR